MSDKPSFLVFLSYASADRVRVEEVYKRLTRHGYSVWMDVKNILAGENWDLEVNRAIKDAQIVIVFISQNSVDKRGYYQREVKKAITLLEDRLDDDIYLIPLRLDATEVPEQLARRQWVDASKTDWFEYLVKSLDAQRGRLEGGKAKPRNLARRIDVVDRVIEESWDGLPGYNAKLRLPRLFSNDKELDSKLEEINTTIAGHFLPMIQEERKAKLQQSSDFFTWNQEKFTRTHWRDVGYSIAVTNDKIVSVRFDLAKYHAGAAHPLYNYRCFNFMLEPLIVIEFMDLFIDPLHGEKKISELCRTSLERKFQVEGNLDEDRKRWIAEGAGASHENFAAFNLSSEVLTLNFPPYQVASYADGSHHVDVLLADIRDLIRSFHLA